ncbi:MFS transporter [Janibacter hoylei]|uniref:Major Facilitator Superfamily n=1 Tax=Brevibacterium casei TaxID=33889 RepID=A0A449D9Q9_9MICO|nr:MFS transporter [Brevibacterium casei]VEW14299.1 Major Facilitator Superfamily [Brevibacterium casei]
MMIAPPLGSARRIAFTAGGAFAAFYIFYTTAPITFAGASLGAGVRVGIVMAVVVAVQPFVGLLGRWIATRRLQVTSAAISMGLGSAIMPFAGHWPGMLLLAVGFGVFVVASTAWIKETAPSGLLGRALGLYGFGSAIGGAFGAPLGLILIEQAGTPGTAVVGSLVALASILPVLRLRTAVSSDVSPGESTASETAPRASRLWSNSRLIGLGAHLLAVTIYAAALSGLASDQNGRGTWLPVLAAFAIQASLAIGRMIGGWAVTRWSPLVVGTSALVLLLGASGIALLDPLPVLTLAAAIGVGLASGACQTVALTWLMQRTDTTTGINRASAAWNICFDIGLGLGALAVGATLNQ